MVMLSVAVTRGHVLDAANLAADLSTYPTGIHLDAMHYLLNSSSHVQRYVDVPAGVFLYHTSGFAVGGVISILLFSVRDSHFVSSRTSSSGSLLRALVTEQSGLVTE